jgi:hypothetical protein
LPTEPATELTFTADSVGTATLQWQPAAGYGSLVVVKEGAPVDAVPVQGFRYTARSAFGAGTTLGNGNFAVFFDSPPLGTGSSVMVVGLRGGGTYHAAVFAVNDSQESETSYYSYYTEDPARASGTMPEAQALSPGDIAFVGINSTNPDQFAFVALVDLHPNCQISFTENAWNGSTLATNEGTLIWESGASIPAGTVVTYSTETGWSAGSGALAGAFALSTDGDQILAYTGDAAAPGFIAGISTTANGWITTGTPTSNTSYLPTALALGITERSFSARIRDGFYSGPIVTGNRAALLAAINGTANQSNWTTTNATTRLAWSFAAEPPYFTINDKQDQTVSFSPAPGNMIFGQTQNLNATASGGGAITYEVVSGLATIAGNIVTATGGTGTVVVRATAAETELFNPASITASFSLSRATPTISFNPTTPMEFGSTQDLAAALSTDSDGVASFSVVSGVGGSITGAILTATASSGSVTVRTSVAGSGNYVASTTIDRVVAFTKATPVILTAPVASQLASGQALSASSLTGGEASVSGSFAFVDPAIVPSATGPQTVRFTPTDATNYNSLTFTVVVTVGGSGSAYDTWADDYGLDPAGNGAPTADPDGDGFSNAQEYAFGTSPIAATAALLTTTSSGGNLVVAWLERSDVTYNVQSTTNLATTAFANDGAVNVEAGAVEPAPPAGYTRKQFSVPATGSKFYRVTATVPSP